MFKKPENKSEVSPHMAMVISQVRKTIDSRKLIKKGDKVLVCVSGGPDSMAMLHVLAGLRRHYNIKLAVAHIDHMLRGKKSRADADFVKRTALRLGLPFAAEKIDVKKTAKKAKMSIEEAAREARYDFFKRTAEDAGAGKIATGHTMDDQAETVLMRLLKGSGSRGLSGIPYKRPTGAVSVIRPLLDVSRSGIEKYLKKNKLRSRTDASNVKTIYLRNRVRHVLMPLLEKEFNPRVKEVLSSMAQNISDEFDYLDKTAQGFSRRFISPSGKKVEIKIPDLLRKHIALQRLIVRQVIAALKGGLKGVTYRHWQEIEAMLSDEKKSSVDLPGGVTVRKRHGRLVFSAAGEAERKKAQPNLKRSIKMNIPGEIALSGLGMKVKSEFIKTRPRFRKGTKKKRVEYVNGDAMRGPLKIRTRRRGDKMRPLGMKSFKKLHDIFIDEKVPLDERDKIPLIISGDRILWAVGVKLSEDCRVGRGTEKIIKLTAAPAPQK